jgi:hypothetical protein
MQVLLAAQDDGLSFSHVDGSSLLATKRAFWSFSVVVLLLSALVWILLLTIPSGFILWQLVWAFRYRTEINAKGQQGLPLESDKAGAVED